MDERRVSLAREAVRGAVDGLLATAAMSAVMLLRQRQGSQGKQPPERIVEREFDALHIPRTERTENVVATIEHFGFGMSMGSLYRLLRASLATPGPELLYGVLYALAVWAISYRGWIPRLGILPSRDRPDRQATMLAAHVVYGGVLGGLRGAARVRSPQSPSG